jgi:hypothetical protein
MSGEWYPLKEKTCYATVTFQVITIVSPTALFTVLKVVRHSMLPVEAAFRIAASVKAPVAVPAGNVAT